MLLLAALPLGMIVGFLRGGTLRGFSEAKLRLGWLIPLGLLLQVLLFPLSYDTNEGVIPSKFVPFLYPLTYVLLLVGCLANRSLAGMKVVALGIALNVLVITANGGYMPADAADWEATGMPQPNSTAVHNNIVVSEGARLAWLGDTLVLPSWIPGGEVFSLGDVFVALGGLLLVQGLMRLTKRRPSEGARSRPPGQEFPANKAYN